MKRLINYYLNEWKNNPDRLPLLVRGARGVGKTFAVRELGNKFTNFLEINLESDGQKLKDLFKEDLDPVRIIRNLSIRYKTEIVPGNTLLFFDEIQEEPQAIIALRYFYEKMPDLHVIAAGSLLDFAIEEVGLPVGRVEALHMYPMSFLEFLIASNYSLAAKEIFLHDPMQPLSLSTHNLLLGILKEYIAVGGMPKVVDFWLKNNAIQCRKMQATIIDTYKQDFGEYAKKRQVKYLAEIFKHAPLQLGGKFKFSKIGEYRKRELEPCLNLLEMARVINKVIYSAGQGVPIGSQSDINDFKLIFLDVGLAQSILGLDISEWLMASEQAFVNQGSIVEAFVGQELLAYADPGTRAQLYYWHRDTRGSEAEIDYLVQLKNQIVPIEVKSGAGRTLKSMSLFLDSHLNSPYGVKFSTNNFSVFEKIQTYPLYAITKKLIEASGEKDSLYLAVMSLL